MKESRLSTFFTWFLLVIVFLLPVFFIPQFANSLITSKLLLIYVLSLTTILTFAATSFKKNALEIFNSPLNIPLLGFGLLVIVSALANQQYPLKQFLGMGGVYLSLVAVVLIAPVLINSRLIKHFSLAVNLAASVLSILSIFQVFGLGIGPLISRVASLEIPNNLAFSLSGAAFISVQLLSVVLLSNLLDQKNWKTSLFLKISTFFIAVGLAINVWGILPGREASFQSLSLSNSGAVAINSLATTKSALLGYGPDSYGNAYNILKPIWVNDLSYWRFTFDAAYNLPLTIVVSLGVIGLIAYLVFAFKTLAVLKKSNDEQLFLKTFILGALIWQLLSPINSLMWGLLTIALSFFIASDEKLYKKISFRVHRMSDLLSSKWTKTRSYIFLSLNLTLILLSILLAVVTFKAFYASHLLYRGNLSISNNDAFAAYDYHKRAKDLVPELDMIRRSNAILNLQIAIALSNKADISEIEQEQVLQLINQAIREARAATTIDPQNYNNWLVLSQIYLQLISVTDQASQEAFNALARAAAVNPNNPEIRMMLGELFLKVDKSQDAAVFFQQAVDRKPDLAIAYYYLARALETNQQLEEAKAAYTSFLILVDKDSEDYKIVEKELNSLIDKMQSNEPVLDEEDNQAATLESNLSDNESILSDLLDQKDTEAIIQDGALTPDQELIAN